MSVSAMQGLHRIRPALATRRLVCRGFATTARRRDDYAFIGLGQMGYQMARNLQSKLPPTDTLTIFDVNKDAMSRLEADTQASESGGAELQLAGNVSDAFKEASTVISCLPEPQHVRAVYESIVEEGAAASSDRVVIDCSTIDPSTSRSVARLVSAAGQGTFVDAPMSGGVVGATAGTLTFMLGMPKTAGTSTASAETTTRGADSTAETSTAETGTAEAGVGPAAVAAAAAASLTDHVVATLLLMGSRVLHCGAQGTGLSAKLANNYLLAVNNIATAEAMNLGVRWGLDPATLAGVINASTGRCWPSEVNNPVGGVVGGSPASRDYAGGFGLSLMRKDLRLAVAAAEEAGARMVLADAAGRVYAEAEEDQRCAGRDFSVVYRYLGGRE
ncbi:3-hydroxyisobutyrate dehydrogenase [Geosmithia morbida]|uniref:3-hydroxyisobutyrate dehydrogenase n=1 Tax=Geosmithia morbida TaxID=1094350 RepID=A0A9P4Z3Q4_9HYPO|nr:3-hydroxyisobutyrate dehydrogenase [Geosmithia morbida]KAF4126892.1 3-hydroxyisobutyrate dehydrogenase [Geosmithia morbida]